MLMFPAMKAVIEHKGKILALQKEDGKLYFPGGRLEPGEHYLDGLRREVLEETGLSITIGRPFAVGEWMPIKNGQRIHIVATFFACTSDDQNVLVSDEHASFIWLDPALWKKYDFNEREVHVPPLYLALKK